LNDGMVGLLVAHVDDAGVVSGAKPHSATSSGVEQSRAASGITGWSATEGPYDTGLCQQSAGTGPAVAARAPLAWGMITCVVEYVIVPAKIDTFERFGRRWMELVDSHGGMHHGYFLPAEGASDKALALFSFPSLAAYEQYRALFGTDPDFIEADRIRDESGCVLRYERTFMRPLLPGYPAE
jgi:hypothetical protein